MFVSSVIPLAIRTHGDLGYYGMMANIYSKVRKNFIPDYVYKASKVDNTATSYLYFDLHNFIQATYTSTIDEDQGKNCFWNFLLKSSLFGPFNLNHSEINRPLAK